MWSKVTVGGWIAAVLVIMAGAVCWSQADKLQPAIDMEEVNKTAERVYGGLMAEQLGESVSELGDRFEFDNAGMLPIVLPVDILVQSGGIIVFDAQAREFAELLSHLTPTRENGATVYPVSIEYVPDT